MTPTRPRDEAAAPIPTRNVSGDEAAAVTSLQHLDPRARRTSPRSTRRRCASTSAARPSTISRISATPGRSSCSTCCSGFCAISTAPNHVTYVRNVTDVDDKINARAARDFPGLPLNEAIAKVTEATERQFHEDVAALGCLPPTIEPRATQHIDTMRAMIERLIARGVAYVAEDHVLFSPSAMDALPCAPRYGTLAHRSLDEMLAGARVDVAPYKRDSMDFVLWKPSKPNEPAGQARRPSPRRADPAGISSARRCRWRRCSSRSAAACMRRPEPQHLRHSRRRDRSRLSSPRERDRAILLRLRLRANGQCLDAQRLPAGRRREDVEEPRQLRHHSRTLAELSGRRSSSKHDADALSTADRLAQRRRDFGHGRIASVVRI